MLMLPALQTILHLNHPIKFHDALFTTLSFRVFSSTSISVSRLSSADFVQSQGFQWYQPLVMEFLGTNIDD